MQKYLIARDGFNWVNLPGKRALVSPVKNKK
jgi:hypothetical protein